MRILNVTESYAPFLEFGGPPVKVRALSEGLAQRGHQVNVLTADWGFESRLTATPEERGADRSPFGWRYQEHGVQAIYLPTWLRYHSLSWNPAVKRYCRARLQNFDIVHIFGLYDLLGPPVAAACRARHIPYVIEPIGMFVPIVRNIWLKLLYHSVFGKRMLAGASAVIATSAQEVEELAMGGVARDSIVLRRNGVQPPARWPPRSLRETLGLSPQVKLVLFLGRLSPKKSPDLLLQAFAKLPVELAGQPLSLVFAGPDEDGLKMKLQRMALELGVAPRVNFCGPLFGEAKWAAYRDADVFVLPSVNENFGNTAAEAIAAGTPVIVSEGCGIAPLLANIAGLVVPHNVENLSSALSRLLSDSQLHTQLAAACPYVTSRLGWEEPIREMETLYARLVKLRAPLPIAGAAK